MIYLKKFFTLPDYTDEAESRQAYFLYIIVWTLIFVPIPFVIYAAILTHENPTRILIQVGFGEAVNIALLFMLHRKYVRAASILQVSAFWIFFTVSAVTGAGVKSEAYLLGYGLIIIIAGILLGGNGSFLFAFLSLLAGSYMVYAQTQGMLISGISENQLTTWMVSLVLFPFGAILQRLASRDIRSALDRARASEEKYRLISQVSSDYTFVTEVNKDRNVSLSSVAGAFQKMTGYTYEEYVSSGGWLAHVHPGDSAS
jgi:PAS domain-containing protein